MKHLPNHFMERGPHEGRVVFSQLSHKTRFPKDFHQVACDFRLTHRRTWLCLLLEMYLGFISIALSVGEITALLEHSFSKEEVLWLTYWAFSCICLWRQFTCSSEPVWCLWHGTSKGLQIFLGSVSKLAKNRIFVFHLNILFTVSADRTNSKLPNTKNSIEICYNVIRK